MLFSARTAEIGLGTGDNTKKPSMKTRSKKLRLLEKKGAVLIVERSNKGIMVEIKLPSEIKDLIKQKKRTSIDLESLGFYKDRRLLIPLLEREGSRCVCRQTKWDSLGLFFSYDFSPLLNHSTIKFPSCQQCFFFRLLSLF